MEKSEVEKKVIPLDYLYLKPSNDRIQVSKIPGFQKALKEGAFPIPRFSFYPRRNNVIDYRILDIFEVARMMRKSKLLREITTKILLAVKNEKPELKSSLKSSLPYICHTGIFVPRKNAGMLLPSFTFQLDVDKVKYPDNILKQLVNDTELEVLIASKSVSGTGAKAMLFLRELVYLKDKWTWEHYRLTYRKVTEILSEYFRENYGLQIDQQMKSISQPFFLFHSPDLWINPNYLPWIND